MVRSVPLGDDPVVPPAADRRSPRLLMTASRSRGRETDGVSRTRHPPGPHGRHPGRDERGRGGDRLATRALRPLVKVQPTNGISDSVHHIFRADSATHLGPPTEGWEAERVEWVPLSDVPRLVGEGDIVSGTGVAELLYGPHWLVGGGRGPDSRPGGRRGSGVAGRRDGSCPGVGREPYGGAPWSSPSAGIRPVWQVPRLVGSLSLMLAPSIRQWRTGLGGQRVPGRPTAWPSLTLTQ